MIASGTKLVPLVSSSATGPLGALHVPRLWLKLTLSSHGALADGYDFCGSGYDQMTIDALGLERDATIAFVRDSKPTYMQFEKYILEKNGGAVPRETIEAHNRAIVGYHHSDELAAQMRAASGIGNASIKDAVTLNMVEDLDDVLHQLSH